MKKLLMTLVIICSCISFTMAQEPPCEGKKPSPAAGKEYPVYEDPAKLIEVMIGQVFVITLNSNATTGYQWQLANPLDNSIVEILGNEYLAPKTGLVGAGGKEIWKFKALDQGKTTIAMKYIRPWEKDVPPVRNVQFRVIIH